MFAAYLQTITQQLLKAFPYIVKNLEYNLLVSIVMWIGKSSKIFRHYRKKKASENKSCHHRRHYVTPLLPNCFPRNISLKICHIDNT